MIQVLIILAATLAWFLCGLLYGKKHYSTASYNRGWKECRRTFTAEVLLLRSQIKQLKNGIAKRREKAAHQKRIHGRFAA